MIQDTKIKDFVINSYQDFGCSLSQLARHLNLKRHQVYYLLRKQGTKLRPVGRPMANLNSDCVKKMKEGGLSVDEIARTLKCGRVTVYNRLGDNSG